MRCFWAIFALGTGLLMAGAFAVETGAISALVAEPGEEFPGGAATARCCDTGRNAFMHPSKNMDRKDGLSWRVGRAIFNKVWVSAGASTTASDGLGPLFNARSCMQCHPRDGRGHPPRANWPDDGAVSMFLRLSIPPQTPEQKKQLAAHRVARFPDPVYGGQLQDLSIQGFAGEGRMHITYQEKSVQLAGGEIVKLRVPAYKVTDWAYGQPHADLMMSPRVAPQMIGLGLLEAISADDILKNADPEDKDGDGISGRASKAWSVEYHKVMLGRFGWKAVSPTVGHQSNDAFAGDLGISNPLFAHASGDCTDRQVACMQAPNGNTRRDHGLEIGPKLNKVLIGYVANLAVPHRRGHDRPEILRGKKLFHQIGCSACHKASFVTGQESSGGSHLAGQKIWPYSDLLLHDMGAGLSDNRPMGNATAQEWRTPPLWGIGLTKAVSGHTYFLHDGRARSLTEAILWHQGEAKKAQNAFRKLDKKDRERLIDFVNSL